MKNLYKALAKFQKEVKSIPKNSKGYGYDYAKLEEIIKVVTPTLHKNGLVVIQTIDTDEIRNIPSVKTILAHTDSGESIESVTPVAEVKLGSMNTYQSLGSGITYMRRYSIAGILGICPDDDIDSNEKLVREVVATNTKKVVTTKMTEANYDSMKASAKKYKAEGKNWSQIEAVMNNNNIEIDKDLFSKIKKELDG
jgi:hypothetical protein|tara:strand:- start:128 stop:715 length:588 start_codon:yes stop_codon:yes gene_type:complete